MSCKARRLLLRLNHLVLLLGLFYFFALEAGAQNLFAGSCHKQNISNIKDISKVDKVAYARELFLAGEYQASIDILESVIASQEFNESIYGLTIAVHNSVKNKKRSIELLEVVIKNKPEAHWAKLELYKLGKISKEEILKSTCLLASNSSSQLLECAKHVLKEGPEFETFLKTAIKKSKKETDPYSRIIASKSYEQLNMPKISLKVLNKIKKGANHYESALREKVRIYSDLGEFNRANKELKKLLEFNNKSPVNHLIALDHYKKYQMPQKALTHFSAASNCLSYKSRDLIHRTGYISEVLGAPFFENQTIQFSFSRFRSYFRPNELLQNKVRGLDFNLYDFNNSLTRLSWNNSLSEKTSISTEVGMNQKGTGQNEIDYWVSAGLKRRSASENYVSNSGISAAYIPVYRIAAKKFTRNSYKLSGTYNLFPHKSSTSYHLDASYGFERILRDNAFNQYSEVTLAVNKKFWNEKAGLNAGLTNKNVFGDEVDTQFRFFAGGEYNFDCGINIKLFNEVFYIPDAGEYTVNTTISQITPLTDTSSLKLSVSNEQDIVNRYFQQISMSATLEKNIYLNNFKAKTSIEAMHITDKGQIQDENLFINFKIGVPF